MPHRHHCGLKDQQVDLADPGAQSLEHFDLGTLGIDFKKNRMLQIFRQQRIQPSHRRRPCFTVEHLAFDLREKTRSGNIVVDVEGDLAVLRAGGDQKIFRVEALFQPFQNGTALGHRLNQKIFCARERIVDWRCPKRNSDVDDGANLEAERLEVLEKQAEVPNRCIGSQQPKTDNLQHTIDGLEHG